VKIRKATPGDLTAIDHIERICFDSSPFETGFIRDVLASHHFITWVAEEGEIIGYITLLRNDDEHLLRLISLAVAPPCRGRGVGKALLETAKKYALEKGIRKLSLEVRISNVAAINLYLQSGFKIKGLIRDYYTRGERKEDALFMTYEQSLLPQ